VIAHGRRSAPSADARRRATVSGAFAQIPVIPRRLGERVKSTRRGRSGSIPGRKEFATSSHSFAALQLAKIDLPRSVT
jgi:hypothetical protein